MVVHRVVVAEPGVAGVGVDLKGRPERVELDAHNEPLTKFISNNLR